MPNMTIPEDMLSFIKMLFPDAQVVDMRELGDGKLAQGNEDECQCLGCKFQRSMAAAADAAIDAQNAADKAKDSGLSLDSLQPTGTPVFAEDDAIVIAGIDQGYEIEFQHSDDPFRLSGWEAQHSDDPFRLSGWEALRCLASHRASERGNPVLKARIVEKEPETITVNGRKVPKPMTVEQFDGLPVGTDYYVASPTKPDWIINRLKNTSMTAGRQWAERGLAHLTNEAATAHAKALVQSD